MSMNATGRSAGNRMTGGDVIPKGYKAGQMQQFTPEQMQLFQQMFGQVGQGSFLSKLAGGDQGAFEQLEAPAMKQFQELQGQTASRFSGAGMGARRSSGFQNAMGQQTMDFAQQLQSQRLGLQSQALQDLKGISGDLLNQQPYERFMIKKQQKEPMWKSLVQGGLTAAGAVAGGIYGGPMGAAAGGQLGSTLGSGFTGRGGGGSYEGIASLPTSWRQ